MYAMFDLTGSKLAEFGVDLTAGEKGRLVYRRNHDLRAVDAKQVGAAHAVIMHVADAVSAANDGLRRNRIGQPDARAEVAVVRIDQSAIVEVATGGADDLVRRRIEVREVVVAFPARRCEFP